MTVKTEFKSPDLATVGDQLPRFDQMHSNAGSFSIPAVGSPVKYQNTMTNPVRVFVSGGTVLTIGISEDDVTYLLSGLLGGMYTLQPGEWIRITYVLPPTVTGLPV